MVAPARIHDQVERDQKAKRTLNPSPSSTLRCPAACWLCFSFGLDVHALQDSQLFGYHHWLKGHSSRALTNPPSALHRRDDRFRRVERANHFHTLSSSGDDVGTLLQ